MALGQKLKTLLKENAMIQEDWRNGWMYPGRRCVKQITAGISLFMLSNVFDCFGQYNMIMSSLYWLTMIAGVIMIVWYFLQTKQYQEIKNEYLI
ncbi:MAG: hypothetical protein NC302_06760 [Bacteroidales bacterium]|nr:hypothetical protein [Bacteroidales bacterium]MCM1415400.1 hypothetical protein [bacterium]MCM1423333.1 hypothetical protein [bacterium]